MRILNLHGLGGSGGNTNYRTIREAFPKMDIVSETNDFVNTNPKTIIEKYCGYGDFDIVVGNSFGGFFAYIIGAKLKIKTVLTNPAIPAGEYIPKLVEGYKYASELDELWEKYQGRNENCHVLLGINDEVLDPNRTNQLLDKTTKDILFIPGEHKLKSDLYENWLTEKLSTRH